MTFSSTLTLGGFLRGLQREMVGLIGSIILIIIILLIVRWFISKLLTSHDIENDEAVSGRKWAGSIAAVLICLVLVGFAINAATYATNMIPHSDIDKSGVYTQMNSNIQK